ncbi:MAG: PQQ-like beta-propeller repeat protein [Calditrichia bacterium]|nr:PQQ-like beta-propeller repeat protein [Calditrichia bacterium]
MSTRRLKYTTILLIFLAGCGSSLRISDFPAGKTADINPLMTSQLTYSRNTVSSQELIPPLTEDWEEDYQSLPNNGFTAVDNWLFFGMQNGYLAAVDIDDGDLEGKKNLGDACAVPPTVYNNILYQAFEIGSYGLIAYDVSDGSSIWAIDGHFSRSSPVIVNELALFQSLRGEVICFNYLTGEEIWRHSLNKGIRNSPAFKDNVLITVTLDGTIYAFESTSGNIIWELNLNSPVFADPVIDGERLYVSSHAGTLFVIELHSGQLLSNKEFSIELFNSPTIDQNSIYIASSNGTLISINKSSLENNWIFSGDGPIFGPALVTNSYVYIATMAQKLYIISKNDGQLIQKIELVGRARSAPIINHGKLILACESKQVIAYVEDR